MLNSYDCQYKKVLYKLINEGVYCEDRTGVGVRKLFDANINVDLSIDQENLNNLPALTLRKIGPRIAFEEMKWMLSGSTDANVLKDKDVHIWDGNTSREFLDANGLNHLKEGHGGKIYGHQFRKFNGHIDQLKNVVDSLLNNPNSRRHYISLWNPSDFGESCLPSCHLSYQFVPIGDHLNLKFYIRSNDFVLGQPMNFMFATFFLTFMANITGFKVGSVACSIADCHIYENHLEAAQEMLDRDPMPMGKFVWNSPEKATQADMVDDLLDNLKWEDVSIQYQSHPKIDREKLKMAV